MPGNSTCLGILIFFFKEKYQLGVGKLIEGLEMGIYTMKRQEKASFVIDWKYAYGGHGKSAVDSLKLIIQLSVLIRS